jgi:hypothetical protein
MSGPLCLRLLALLARGRMRYDSTYSVHWQRYSTPYVCTYAFDLN